MFELAIAVPSLALVIAAWDVARRHFGQRDALTAGHVGKLEQRIADLEKGQRDLAMQLSGSPKQLSRFQRG